MESNNQIPDRYGYPGSEVSLQTDALNQVAQAAGVPMDPAMIGGVVEVSKALIQSFADYRKCAEMEETKRQQISATLRARLGYIATRHMQVTQYMDYEYGQVGQSIQNAFACLRTAQEMGDKDLVKLYLDFIHNQQQGVREHFRPLIEEPLPFDL